MVKFNLKENIPKKTCEDKNCPYHGNVKVRGRYLQGKVVSDKMYRTVTIERHFLRYVPKYNRYTRKKTKIHAHNPECIDAKVGMTVLIGETRPLSKTKNFVVLKIISDEEIEKGKETSIRDGKQNSDTKTKKTISQKSISEKRSSDTDSDGNQDKKEESKEETNKEDSIKKSTKKSNKE